LATALRRCGNKPTTLWLHWVYFSNGVDGEVRLLDYFGIADRLDLAAERCARMDEDHKAQANQEVTEERADAGVASRRIASGRLTGVLLITP
jgi:hypothetical protein